MTTLQAFESDLNGLTTRGVRNSIEKMAEVLTELGNPEKSFPILHIGGTNGKGSTSGFLAQIISQSGFRVGLAMSPHVLDFRERIQFFETGRADTLVSASDLLELHADLKAKSPDFFGLTYYEYGLLLALLSFQKAKVDFAILEVGLGGRLDATNACGSLISAITSIGLDHQHLLGDTLEEILAEKIDIAKEGTDFVFGEQASHLIQQAQDYCQGHGVRFHFPSENLSKVSDDWPDVFGNNLAVALRICELLQEQGYEEINLESLNLSLPPARYEFLQKTPDVLMDGAHNEPALKVLKSFVESRWGSEYDLVFGCLKDRDLKALLEIIRPETGEVYLPSFEAGNRAIPSEKLAQIANDIQGKTVDFSEDFATILNCRKPKRPLLICGSFLLCGEFQSFWKKVHL